MLAAFRVRSFRFQWPADLLTSWAFEMETLILGWYVIVQTGSVLLLSTFASLQYLGTLAGPMFGVLGDRLGGRAMLGAMRSTYAVLAALVMALALAGALTPAWVLVVAALAGIVRPNDLVMRHSLIGETIPREHLMGALGMSRASMDSARVAGALAGAGLSTALGVGAAYVFVTLFYGASLALTFGVARRRPVPDPGATPRPAPAAVASSGASQSSRSRDLMDGLVHVLATPALLAPLLLAFLINLTAYPLTGGLLPYVAQRVYMVDATGLGWLIASFSIGALLGSVAMVATGGSRRPERSMLVHTAIWYALLLGFAHVRSLNAGIALLLLAGFVQSVAMISMMATLLASAGDRFRARVMGARTLAVYGSPLGLMGCGLLIAHVGYPVTVSVSAAVGLVFTVVIAIRWRANMWRRKAVCMKAIGLVPLILLASCATMADVTPAVRADLAPTGKVRAGINYGNFILATKDRATGESRGVAVDLTRELGARLGVPVEIVAYESVAAMVDAAKTAAWDIAFLGIDPARAGDIGFTAAYLEIEATYLVPAASPLRAGADVDREGVRVAAPARANYELFLSRSLTRAQLVRAPSADAAFDLLATGKVAALAGLRQSLIGLAERLPGSRMLDGQFMAVQQAVGVPRGRDAGLAYLRGFVEEAKASGLVTRAIERTGARGVSVAPPAPAR